jgi:hypothetical protein
MAEAKVAPSFLYYALVDGTSEVDSVAFARNLAPKKGFGGWRNLLDFIDPSPFDPAQLVDGAHIYLPIFRLDDNARSARDGVAVVCPGGHAGLGKDEMWTNYDPAPREWLIRPTSLGLTRTTSGRHTAAEESAEAMEAFILQPSVQVDEVGVGSILAGKSLHANATVFRASFLYLSSHGWLGGFMKGNELDAYPAAKPDQAKGKYVPFHSYFQIGRVDSSGEAFRGPTWIVLAQCSTVNTATWAMWARVMARSSPPVRGILGYEESSPEAGAASGIAHSFFAALRAKKDFLSAWRSANAGQLWAALVHKEAHKDTLVSFPTASLPPSTLADYIGYVPSIPKGQVIEDPAPPFKVQLFRVRHKGLADESLVEVRPDTLDEGQSMLEGGGWYVVRLSATNPFSEASIRWVHIRVTYREQFAPARLFTGASTPAAGVTVDLKGPQAITAKMQKAVTSLEITLQAQTAAKLQSAGLEAHHSYLWIAAATKSPLQSHDFKTIGLLYMG